MSEVQDDVTAEIAALIEPPVIGSPMGTARFIWTNIISPRIADGAMTLGERRALRLVTDDELLAEVRRRITGAAEQEGTK